MSAVLNRVERESYRDSVALMRVSRALAAHPGVEDAAVMIGTPSNKQLLRDAGLLAAESAPAGANDLIVAVRARDARAAQAAIDAAAGLLAQAASSGEAGAIPQARTLEGALGLMPRANLALISVPGEFAAREARRALARGLNVLLFSDNVPLEQELALKRSAQEKGLLLMGPDCGTALIAGAPLAFANVVPRGDVGIVSASGTGLQEVSCLLARLGGGVSHGIGVGGRDLDARIGALGTLGAIAALERDPATREIVLLSKPPAAVVAATVMERVARSPKPFIVCFLGLDEVRLPGNARLARTLTEAAELAAGRGLAEDAQRLRASGWVHGLYCGGTLCAEAELIFRRKGLRTGPQANAFIDLGDDRYTRGRPHPMIDPELRNDHVRQALANPSVGAILLDVVLGYGAHADPAGVLLENDLSAKPVVASVTGTQADPQGYSRQVAALREAGVIVAASNAQAANVASQCSPA